MIMIRTVLDYLEMTERRIPDTIALADENESITFRQLKAYAQSVATAISHNSVINKPIAVYIEKSVKSVVSFLGVAMSGNYYVPIDVTMPPQRIATIIGVLDPAMVVCDRNNMENATKFFNSIPTLAIEEMLNINSDLVELENIQKKIIDTDPLYILFTSGSTGTPKGVVISHRSVIDYTEWVSETFAIDETNVFGNQAPFYFDNSVLDIYQMLKNGARLEIIPERLFAFPIELLSYMNSHEINSVFWVPSALCHIAGLKALDIMRVDGLKLIIFCGEVMPTKYYNMWHKCYPDAVFANLYGPTEITDVCAYYIIDRDFKDSETIPIGIPCRNTDIIVLNEQNAPVQGDEIGELCVRGSSLALGYYNNPEKTNQVFVQNPLNNSFPELIYRTGDLVYYNDRHELVYSSRKDFQIKHMGHRIELGEIETAASSLEEITSCCCMYDKGKSNIVLFYSGDIDKRNIKNLLKSMIPQYMIPQRFIKIEKMPLNTNGKTDRKKLYSFLTKEGCNDE